MTPLSVLLLVAALLAGLTAPAWLAWGVFITAAIVAFVGLASADVE